MINQSMVGAVLESRKFRNVDLVYGALHGVRGIVNEEFLDLTQETTHNLELVAETPASALGSTRDKPDLKYCQEIFKVLRAHQVAYFFYIDGVDTIIAMATAYGRDLGFGVGMLIAVLLVIQVVAFPCSLAFGRLALGRRIARHRTSCAKS